MTWKTGNADEFLEDIMEDKMSEKTIYVHTDTTDQFQFSDIADALNYIEDTIEGMADESMTVYVELTTEGQADD